MLCFSLPIPRRYKHSRLRQPCKPSAIWQNNCSLWGDVKGHSSFILRARPSLSQNRVCVCASSSTSAASLTYTYVIYRSLAKQRFPGLEHLLQPGYSRCSKCQATVLLLAIRWQIGQTDKTSAFPHLTRSQGKHSCSMRAFTVASPSCCAPSFQAWNQARTDSMPGLFCHVKGDSSLVLLLKGLRYSMILIHSVHIIHISLL